ncbi:MAG: hypothetical protein JXA90_04820 [Planctomycetes bacterium]|nr:hypothetical protein [Planctomycetota bacterium]
MPPLVREGFFFDERFFVAAAAFVLLEAVVFFFGAEDFRDVFWPDFELVVLAGIGQSVLLTLSPESGFPSTGRRVRAAEPAEEFDLARRFLEALTPGQR